MIVFRMSISMLPVTVLVWGVFLSFFLSSMSNINIASLNVNSARDCKKRAEIFELFKQRSIDVALLQETRSDEKKKLFGPWNGMGSFLSHNNSLSAGVAVLFSKNFTPVSYEVDDILKGRILKIRTVFENEVFVFICAYAPTATKDRIVFLDTLCLALQKM